MFAKSGMVEVGRGVVINRPGNEMSLKGLFLGANFGEMILFLEVL
jgi:hypothetical protein